MNYEDDCPELSDKHGAVHVGLAEEGGAVSMVLGPVLEIDGREVLAADSGPDKVLAALGYPDGGWSGDQCYSAYGNGNGGLVLGGCQHSNVSRSSLTTFYLLGGVGPREQMYFERREPCPETN